MYILIKMCFIVLAGYDNDTDTRLGICTSLHRIRGMSRSKENEMNVAITQVMFNPFHVQNKANYSVLFS